MDRPPRGDHGTYRYDYIEIAGNATPPDSLVEWVQGPMCPDCRPNVFLTYMPDGIGNLEPEWPEWDIIVAHDEGCPNYKAIIAQRGYE